MSDTLNPESIPGPRVTLKELAVVQSLAGEHLTFVLTLSCPLKCAHCAVNSGPDKTDTTMPLDVVQNYAAQMSELHAYGIRTVSFTGGEPLLAREQLSIMSNAAAEAGLTCGLVTSGYWAANERLAQRIVESLPGIQKWDVSIDAYHAEFVDPERFRIAYQVIRRLGRQPNLRFTYNTPLTAEDQRLLEFILSFADECHVAGQKLRKMGRARALEVPDAGDPRPLLKPCTTMGMVIRYDGSVAPCCLNLVEERCHPFQFGDARARPLTQIQADFMTFPLLQMLRVIGFGEAMHWLEEVGLDQELEHPLPSDVCELCLELSANPRISRYLVERASKPETRLKIAILASRILGEHQMLQRTVRELQHQSQQIEDFELAAALAAETAAD